MHIGRMHDVAPLKKQASGMLRVGNEAITMGGLQAWSWAMRASCGNGTTSTFHCSPLESLATDEDGEIGEPSGSWHE